MKKICIALIRFYRKCISPLKPPCCRFYPSCSAYALTAFERRGFFAGFLLSLGRVLRCNPFGGGGYDPVPSKGFKRVKLGLSEEERETNDRNQIA
ncbi:MAG: membrane protein insertion efficiency factor YidD [Eubacteriales bacterium]